MSQHNSCQQQLEQLQKEFDEFAYLVSHDLKAPVRAISNLSHWIEEDLADNLCGDVKENMKLLRSRANRLEHMIESLLLYSRISRYDLDVEPTNTEELVRNAAAKFDSRVVLHLPQPLPELITYKQKLSEVFFHLIANSATFSNKPHTNITVTCHHADNKYYEFVVKDDGNGVPENALDKIFNLFYTVSAKDTQETVGAGLAISKKIIQFVQGFIRAENNNENGLTIRFTWPKEIAATTISYQ